MNREYAQDLRRNVLAMLFDVLELQPYPTVRAELISILESFLPYLLGAGDYSAVAYVLREVKAVLQRARELLPEHRKALEDLPGRLSEAEPLSQLLQSLDEAAAHPSADELGELFGELRPEALPTLLAWMPQAEQRARQGRARRRASAPRLGARPRAGGRDRRRRSATVALEAVKLAGQAQAGVGGAGAVPGARPRGDGDPRRGRAGAVAISERRQRCRGWRRRSTTPTGRCGWRRCAS